MIAVGVVGDKFRVSTPVGHLERVWALFAVFVVEFDLCTAWRVDKRRRLDIRAAAAKLGDVLATVLRRLRLDARIFLVLAQNQALVETDAVFAVRLAMAACTDAFAVDALSTARDVWRAEFDLTGGRHFAVKHHRRIEVFGRRERRNAHAVLAQFGVESGASQTGWQIVKRKRDHCIDAICARCCGNSGAQRIARQRFVAVFLLFVNAAVLTKRVGKTNVFRAFESIVAPCVARCQTDALFVEAC